MSSFKHIIILHSYIIEFKFIVLNRIITKLITPAIKNFKFYAGK